MSFEILEDRSNAFSEMTCPYGMGAITGPRPCVGPSCMLWAKTTVSFMGSEGQTLDSKNIETCGLLLQAGAVLDQSKNIYTQAATQEKLAKEERSSREFSRAAVQDTVEVLAMAVRETGAFTRNRGEVTKQLEEGED